MTEAEWLNCQDCEIIWEVIKSKRSARMTDRTMRLYLVAFWGSWEWGESADIMLKQVAFAETWAETSVRPRESQSNYYFNYQKPKSAVTITTKGFPEAKQAAMLRCVFGNPFRPITLNPSWLTSTVLALANCIYQEKAFDRMPFLADALQDAGCDNEDILNHCRRSGEHVRGCWCVDLILCKL